MLEGEVLLSYDQSGVLVCWFGRNRRGFALLSSELNGICLYCEVFTEESDGILMNIDHSASSLFIFVDDAMQLCFSRSDKQNKLVTCAIPR